MSLLLLTVFFVASGCSKAYYRTLESFGIEKREILVDRVEETRDSQEDAAEQFQTALEQFTALTGFDGGDLEKTYSRLEKAFERSESRADEVRENIDDVQDVAEALFDEWEDELDDYTDQSLRRASERQLEQTRAEYEQLMRVMRRAEDKMDPVLNAFRDQVLFLKHNLNARAIASLEGNVEALESDIAALISEMKESIDEANRFISAMQG